MENEVLQMEDGSVIGPESGVSISFLKITRNVKMILKRISTTLEKLTFLNPGIISIW